jgi:ATP phosphoribosyltransferase regulatory subunit
MRDLLHPESGARRALGARLLQTFALHGYDLVTTPPFEHAEVLERGLAAVDRRDLLRFVEPETGEVALLRPDITPQIARIVATRLAGRPAPWRLCYDGTVIRRRRGRARRQRQIAQCGVECIGIAGPDGDAEVIALAAEACRAAGLTTFRIELGQVEIGRAALAAVPADARSAAAEALTQKDGAALTALLRAAGVGDDVRARLTALVSLDGPATATIARARALLGDPTSGAALDDLAAVAARLATLGLGDDVVGVDLGDVRGSSYYTGVRFTVLAEGPGEPVGAGGRYDNLLGHFDAPAPATGFGLDLDNLEWALAHAGHAFGAERGVRVALAAADPQRRRAIEDALRTAGIGVAVVPAADAPAALAFARAWGYDAALVAGPSGARLTRASDGATAELDALDARAVLEHARAR